MRVWEIVIGFGGVPEKQGSETYQLAERMLPEGNRTRQGLGREKSRQRILADKAGNQSSVLGQGIREAGEDGRVPIRRSRIRADQRYTRGEVSC